MPTTPYPQARSPNQEEIFMSARLKDNAATSPASAVTCFFRGGTGLQSIEFCSQAKDLFVLSPQIIVMDTQSSMVGKISRLRFGILQPKRRLETATKLPN